MRSALYLPTMFTQGARLLLFLTWGEASRKRTHAGPQVRDVGPRWGQCGQCSRQTCVKDIIYLLIYLTAGSLKRRES